MRGLGLSNQMFFIGVVENNNDEQLQGRVQVRAFGVHGENTEVPKEDLPWAICIAGNYDPNVPVPPLNSFVYGVMLDGDEAQHPLILGMIPTQYVEEINAKADGYGVDVGPNDPLAKGFRPRLDEVGEHQSSRLRRGEYVDQTIHKDINAAALQVQNQGIAGKEETWSQPPSAYSAKYPYNRVIETNAHTIELDDTPGGERIMIHHKSGSFVQIDSIGTVTERAEGDRYEINIGTKHESSGGSVVTINGNAYVKVNGNKTEEIEGNYKLLVHGTTEVSSGGNLFLNSGDALMARGSTTKIEAAADALTLFGKEQIQMEAEKQINTVSQSIKNNALLDFAVYSTKGFKFTTPADFHLQSSNIIMSATGLVPPAPGVSAITGTIGTPIQAGFNLVAPGVNIAAANGGFSGIWNASVLNGGIVTGTTGNFPTLNAGEVTAEAVNTTILGAPMPIAPSGGGVCLPNGTARIATLPDIPVFPSLPLITPPAVSDPTPPIFGKASGLAYPRGNGDGKEFAAAVLTSPFDFIGEAIDALTQGGYGITLAQMPEPTSKNEVSFPNEYSPKGYAVGTYSSAVEDTD